MEYNTQVINDIFLESLNTSEGIEKIADIGTNFIRLKLRETGFARKLFEPEFLTVGELYRDENHDQLYKLKDIEPDSKAMAVTLRGRADYSYITGKRYRINFFPIETVRYEKKEEELLAYEMPITKLIEQNSIPDLQRVEDGRFISHVDASVTISGNLKTNLSYVNGSHGKYIPKATINALADMLTDKELELNTILMNKKDWATVWLWPDLGSSLQYEVTPNGYRYETLNNIRVITTNKSDIVPAGTVYGFAPQSFFGDFYILRDASFYINKKEDIISFWAKELIGMGIGNVNGVAKVVLNS